MVQLSGIITRITFQNEETGFTVFRLSDEDVLKEHVCVGIMPTITCGESIQARGTWIKDKRFGLQFNVEAYELTRPTTIEGIRMLLSSGLITDIGPSRAQNIIDTFGTETLTVLDTTPERLREVPGIGKKRLDTIKNAWQRHQHIKTLMLYLQEYGITVNLIHKIYKAYGNKAKEVISANPYKLIDDIWGVGFKKADAIARKLGFEENAFRRIKAGIIFLLQEASNDGHVYLPKNECIDKAAALLEIDEKHVLFSLDHMINEKIIIADDTRLYLPMFFHTERAVAAMLSDRIVLTNNKSDSYTTNMIIEWRNSYSAKTGWVGDAKQIQAVHAAIQNNILVITGGPGTGKTTTLQVIVSFYRDQGRHVSLAAPTGRAAQRMGDIAGLQAQTLHRLLEYNPRKKGAPFARNKDNPLTTDVLICDEVSMIDLFLMHALLGALRRDTTVIFTGDSNQLPSVGAGNVLADIIRSGMIPHSTLTTIFRQAALSRIVTAAHEIIQGIVPHITNDKQDNCFFIHKENPQVCLDTIIDLVTHRLPSRYGYDPVKDIQVLSPMHKGTLGTQSINRLLQKKLNTSEQKLFRGETVFCKGDKVMQVRNNYDSGVFNGDIGFIETVSENTECTVNFNDKICTYQLKDLDELEHAYCISIHKSQGCEFTAVVIPLMTQHYIMLQRNLLYTALTRGRKLCVFVGTTKAFAIAVGNAQAFYRYSQLADLIQKKVSPA
jgi:exodeoxyribonuclease V alpha subunit